MVSPFSSNIFRRIRNLAQIDSHIWTRPQGTLRMITQPAMDPQTISATSGTASMAYEHCKTRVVNLIDLNIPESATEEEYKHFYNQISASNTPTSRALTDAVNSVALGIAPPVAFPTETVYGLGADATNRASTAGIFAAKGRPSDNPLIVHVASVEQLERLTGEPIPTMYTSLVKEHWPGPLTILVPIPEQNSTFAPNVHPGQRTIGFRIPSSKYARFFITVTGKPIAAPSANSSGKPSPTTAQHVLDDLNGKINFILDGGNCDVGVESTVVDGLHDPPLILRPGGLSQDDLIAHGRKYGNAWLNVDIGYQQAHSHHDAKVNGTKPTVAEEAPRAPGMKYKHYAPRGRMILFQGKDSLEKVHLELDSLISALAPTANGSTSPHPSSTPATTPLNIAILTTTSWPQHANLPTNPTPNISNTPHSHSHSPPNTNPESSNSSTLQPEPNTSTTTTLYKTHTIHTLPLGHTAQQIAQNLFAALRTCDDLNCHFILAEAPLKEDLLSGTARATGVVDTNIGTNSNGHTVGDGDGDGSKKTLSHRFDAVLERMRKAASKVVE